MLQDIYKKFEQYVDTEYAIDLTSKLSSFEFRVAGTQAEKDAAAWIAEEMKKIGLQNVTTESFPCDSWGFKSAFADVEGSESLHCEGTTMVPLNGTDPEGVTAEVVYVMDGTREWYDEVDVKGKIVFMDTNMFGDYWINVLFHQAQVRGAAGIILTPVGLGPGTATEDICTIQDYMGATLDIPAVMVTMRDGAKIREMLKAGESVKATIKIDVDMVIDTESEYVYGFIPGRNPDRYIIINGHFDAYFKGFSDNASSFGTEMAIAKALIDMDYQPESTWIILTNGSEETGCQGTRADWLHGIMWVLKQHPDWTEKTIVLENIETTTLLDTKSYNICIDNVYHDVIRKIFENIRLPEETPDGLHVQNIGTGADHLLTSIEGVPSYMVLNTPVTMDGVTNREVYMNYYHTRIDDYDHANLKAMKDHNRIYGEILLAYDQLLIAPMQFNGLLDFFWEGTDSEKLYELAENKETLKAVLEKYQQTADAAYKKIEAINGMKGCLQEADPAKAAAIYDAAWEESKKLQAASKLLQHETHKFDNWTNAFMGHKQPYGYVTVIDGAISELEQGAAGEACEGMKYLNNNYFYPFDKEVYDLYAVDIYDETLYKQYWYTGLTIMYPNMWEVLNSIESKKNDGKTDFEDEIKTLKEVRESQYGVLQDILKKECEAFCKAEEIIASAKLDDILDMGEQI